MKARLLALVATLLSADALAQTQPLYVVPLQPHAHTALRAGAHVTLALHSRDPSALAAQLQVAAPPAGKPVEYALNPYRAPREAKSRTWRESTFVVDFEEQIVTDLYEDLIEAETSTPNREHFIRFVAATLTPTVGRGWDVASTTAQRREGDCTEFAVTLTALARAASLPARVVTGIVIVQTPQGPAAFGHAWSELKEGNEWRVADAALAGTEVVGYIPLGALTNESASFTLDLAQLMQTWVQRIEVLPPAPARRTR